MWPQSQSLYHPKDLPQGSPRVRDYKPQCKRHAPSSGGSLATQDAEFYTVGGDTRVRECQSQSQISGSQHIRQSRPQPPGGPRDRRELLGNAVAVAELGFIGCVSSL